jgi:phosphate transport system permease protein
MAASVGVLVFIFYYIIRKGAGEITYEYISSPPSGFPVGTEGGIFPAIIGSIMLMAIASIIAGLFGVGTAAYVVFYSRNEKIKGAIELVIQCIAGIPSIVFGLFGYSMFVISLGLGRSLLSAGITLGIMIYPYVEIRVEKSFSEVERDILRSSYGLGISKQYTVKNIVLPLTAKEIVSSLLIGGGHALGAAAPIILTGVVISAGVPKSISSPFMALPFHLYMLISQGISVEKGYATALVLVTLMFAVNILSMTITGKRGA